MTRTFTARLDVLPLAHQSDVLQERPNTLTASVPVSASDFAPQSVKVSFFGEIGFGRVGEPEFTSDGVLPVASLDDLMATTLKVILQRPEAKDYRDIVAMLEAHIQLPLGLVNAREMFHPTFQPSESLQALSYFGDGDLSTLTSAEKRTLVNAASTVRDLPLAKLAGCRLSDV